MSEIIRHGKIIIDIESGKVDIKAPQLTELLNGKEREAIAQQKVTQEILKTQQAEQELQVKAAAASKERAAALEAEAAAASRIAAEKDRAATASQKAAVDAARAAQQQEQAIAAVAQKTASALAGVAQLGEGFFLLGRAAVLFGSSTDEGMQELIRNLATVQAAFDLFKGAIQIFQGVTQVTENLRAARAAQAAATAAATAAESGQAAALTATGTAAAGATVAISSLTVVLGVVAVAAAAAAVAMKIFRDRQADARDEALEMQRINEQGMKAYLATIEQQNARDRERAKLLADVGTQEEKIAAIRKAQAGAGDADRRSKQIVDQGLFQGAQAEAIAIERQKAMAAIDAVKQEKELRKQAADETARQVELQIRAAQEQERTLETAKRQLELEQQKVQSFETQFGQLTRLEQERLKKIGQKVETGQQLSRFEESELRRVGGDAGRRVADDIAGKRGREQGADDVLRSLGGLGAFTAAQGAAAREQTKFDALTGGLDLSSYQSKLEAQAKATVETTEKAFEKLDGVMRKYVDTLTVIDERLSTVERAAMQQGGR